jgi:hypothetical protein
MTEAELQRRVLALAARYDVHAHHTRDSRGSTSGWPDLALLGTHAAAFRELKTASGSLSSQQRQVGARMRAAGLDWGVWRPAGLDDGRIEAELAALSGRRPWNS